MKLHKIQDNDTFGVLSDKTKVLLNYDYASLKKYKDNKRLLKENVVMKEEINNLKNDVDDLKQLVQKLLGK
ncbi:MAG: hypothetical protein EBU90_07610 [Proteobacteria bacterium]|nr:hypothetical protein [Pseudomonadota bacterium]NBP13432.1 hypothetical protein [bacterium]